jgi:hypothetical protein
VFRRAASQQPVVARFSPRWRNPRRPARRASPGAHRPGGRRCTRSRSWPSCSASWAVRRGARTSADVSPRSQLERRARAPEVRGSAGPRPAHPRPYYSWASHEVHANPKGSRLNALDGSDGQAKLTGRTNNGLADPAQSALIALHQPTSALITCPGASNPSGVLGTHAVAGLLEEACKEFARSSRKMAS